MYNRLKAPRRYNMKILLYSECQRLIQKSGVGKAIHHQEKALKLNNVTYEINDLNSDYDIVHINTVGPASFRLALKAQKKNKKVIMHAHSTEEDFRDSFFFSNPLSPLFKQWLKYTYKQGTQIITPTPYSKKLLEGYNLGIPIHVVSNGIDPAKFIRDESKRKAFRELYGFKQQDKIVLSVGLLIKRKGIFDFVELARSMPNHQFVWCGDTSSLLLTSEVKSLFKHLPSNAHFLGYVSDMPSAYSGADVFFMPTYEETEGIVVLEALAAELPIVIRDIPVFEDWLIDKVHCFKGRTNKDFLRLITSVVEDDRGHLLADAYAIVEERTLDKVGMQLKEIYANLM